MKADWIATNIRWFFRSDFILLIISLEADLFAHCIIIWFSLTRKAFFHMLSLKFLVWVIILILLIVIVSTVVFYCLFYYSWKLDEHFLCMLWIFLLIYKISSSCFLSNLFTWILKWFSQELGINVFYFKLLNLCGEVLAQTKSDWWVPFHIVDI